MYFAVYKMSYFSVSGPGLPSPFLMYDSHDAYKMTKIVSRMCLRYKTSNKFCSFSATDCPIFNVD